jgi:hypothetical protein
MKRVANFLVLALALLFMPNQIANADNPFPGVPYGAEIPGLSKIITCTETPQIPDDCVRQGGGQVFCPTGSANDITPTLRPDGSWASLKSWCRNSWSPPTTAADDEDFRNRQQLAVAAATLESQAYSAANPGEQKCITWGPIVHANGISTASGGVCANVVGTKPDGSTVAVAPSRVGSESTGGTTFSPPTADSSTATTTRESATAPSRPATTGAQTLIPYIDLTQYGFGRPFSKVVAGNLSAAQCPAGFQAATNSINTGFSEYGATECWPSNAWAAYSIGGAIWTQFKSSNGSLNAEAEAARRVQVNAIRALALQQAQNFANQTPGLKRCNNWSAFGESGQECAYIPIQNNSPGGMQTSSSGDTSTSIIRSANEVVVATVSSLPGQSQLDWEKSDVYKFFVCPSGSGRAISIDLKGTVSRGDDVWTVSCVQVGEAANLGGESSTVQSSAPSLGDTTTATSSAIAPLTSNETITAVITSDPVDFKGTVKQITELMQSLDLSKSEEAAITAVTSKLTNIKTISKITKFTLPNSPMLIETAKSLTPSVCKITGLIVQPKKAGICQISYTVEGESGNSFETTKKVTFKK